MGNMSYCRFRNTLRDLRDCYQALIQDGIDDLSNTEKEAAKALIKLAGKIHEGWRFEADEDDE